MLAASGTMTTRSPISRRKKSAAVVFPPPGAPVRTTRQPFAELRVVFMAAQQGIAAVIVLSMLQLIIQARGRSASFAQACAFLASRVSQLELSGIKQSCPHPMLD